MKLFFEAVAVMVLCLVTAAVWCAVFAAVANALMAPLPEPAKVPVVTSDGGWIDPEATVAMGVGCAKVRPSGRHAAVEPAGELVLAGVGRHRADGVR